MKKLTMFFFCMPVVVFCQWNQASPTKLTTTNAVDISGDLWVRNGAILSANFTDTDPANTWNSSVLIRNDNASVGTFSRLSFVSESGGLGGIAVKKTGEFTGDMHLQVRNGPGFYLTRLFIKSDGNIGIGTNTPTGKLDIRHAGGQLRLSGGTVAGGVWTDHADILYLADWDTGAKGLSINMTSGNVGIGTTLPDAKLAVKGDIHTREVRVDMNGAMVPDYVFEKQYSLMPLPEVEAYINQNKHLPEVPSAKEMEANGLNLKAMNLLLLKKVEEITLHLIEQQKQISRLQSENEMLKQKMQH